MGIIFSIGMLLICLLSFGIILRNSLKESDRFYRMVCIGLGTIMIVQCFLTVGGGIKFIARYLPVF